MHVTVLVPDIHDRPTGGNIYNRRIITKLREDGLVEEVPWRPKTEPVPSLSPSEEGIIVVDSLLIGADTPLRALRTAYPSAAVVLLAHYLHCIDPNERDSPEADAERAALPLFDGVVTTSRYAQEAVVEAGVPTDRTGVAPPGLDDAYRDPVPERPDRETPRLLTVANLLPGKGLRTFVDVLATLADLDWSWTLVGDNTLAPDFATALHDRIRASPIVDRVTCTGAVPIDALRAQYDRADVFVLPSRFETCSMATREAMARGCPVVGHAVGGLPHNLGDAPAGRLVPPARPEALADALRPLLTDAARRACMGTAARVRSRSFPTWDEAGARFRSVVQSFASPER
jgi:glycosyltransferase involved in cell wall biosynthesis